MLAGTAEEAQAGSDRDLKNFPLLHDDSYRSWERWLAAAGAKGVNARRGVICGDRNSMLQAALAGQGVAITSAVSPRAIWRAAAGTGVQQRDPLGVLDLRGMSAAAAERPTDRRRDGMARRSKHDVT